MMMMMHAVMMHAVLQKALVTDAESRFCNSPSTGVGRSPFSANNSLPSTPVRTRCTVPSVSVSTSRNHDLGQVCNACQTLQTKTSDRSLNISRRMTTARTASALQHTALQPEVQPETERVLMHLEAELVDVAMQRAPQHLKVRFCESMI